MYSYRDGQLTLKYTTSERVVGRKESLRDITTWAIDRFAKSEQFNVRTEFWVDQRTGLYRRYERATQHSQPSRYLINNETVMSNQSRTVANFDLERESSQQTVIVTDVTGKRHEMSTSVTDARPSIYLITRRLNVGDWYPYQRLGAKQVLEIATISVPAGTFTCWKMKGVQSEGHQQYFDYFDINTGLLIRHENMVNKAGTWEIIERSELQDRRVAAIDRSPAPTAVSAPASHTVPLQAAPPTDSAPAAPAMPRAPSPRSAPSPLSASTTLMPSERQPGRSVGGASTGDDHADGD